MQNGSYRLKIKVSACILELQGRNHVLTFYSFYRPPIFLDLWLFPPCSFCLPLGRILVIILDPLQ